MTLKNIQLFDPRDNSKTVSRIRAGFGFALVAFVLFALPATAQDSPIPRLCGFSFFESEDYCSLFGLVLSWEDCKCVPAAMETPGMRNICDFTPEASVEICKSRGMAFDPVGCRCVVFRLVPNNIPEIPRHWWETMPSGLITWREGRLLLHRGDGTFIDSSVATLDAAMNLVLEQADAGAIEAHDLTVVDALELQ